jgi:frizzled 1/7
MYVPVCTVLEEALPPCRSLCNEARSGCEHLMNRFGFQWPENLECSRFPEGGLCVGENRSVEHGTTTVVYGGNDGDDTSPQKPGGDIPFDCPPPYKVHDNSMNYKLRIGDKEIPNCGMPCEGKYALFNANSYPHVRYVVAIAAVACLISTSFTVLTFLVDMARFRYPERPIIFLSACYSIIAITYIVGFAVGDQVACIPPLQSQPADGEQINVVADVERSRLVVQGTKREVCTVLFIMLYFFYMASSVWWVILSITWFLSAGLKWGNEAIESNSQYFHLAAWAVPAVKTIAILATGAVDGDTLAGVCSTGITSVSAMRGFLLAPLCIYLAVGTCFLLAGFVALCRIRTVMKNDGTRTDKLEKLMVRIGIFGVLYTVPAAVVIGCYVYEQWSRDAWMTTWHSAVCEDHRVPCAKMESHESRSKPDVNVFMIKYLMTLIVGITSGFWIWSSKTVASWSKFYARLCRHSQTERVQV